MRTIPVQQSIRVEWPVAPYMQAREIIKTKEKIALADCICRVQQKLVGNECDKPKEVCLLFGFHADYYVENKLGRYISQEEALQVLDISEKAGLVNQPANMINPGGMCNCCGDCCGLLRELNKMSNPAQVVFSHYYATVDPELCTACETCLTRCQMAAIGINDDQVAFVNTDRCIGCGLCVTTCPSQAMALLQKPQEQHMTPPVSGRELMEQTSKIRGTTLIPLSISAKG